MHKKLTLYRLKSLLRLQRMLVHKKQFVKATSLFQYIERFLQDLDPSKLCNSALEECKTLNMQILSFFTKERERIADEHLRLHVDLELDHLHNKLEKLA